MHGIAKLCPQLEIPIVTGVSAGGINACCLASHAGNLQQATASMVAAWRSIDLPQVVRTDAPWMLHNFLCWSARLATAGRIRLGSRALLDTAPLRRFLVRTLGSEGELTGIARNIEQGRLTAAAIATLDYRTGQTVTWVEGREGTKPWTRPDRVSRVSHLSIDHVMASAALPLVFPAVRLAGGWYGDGGIRLMAPLSPALFLGADRILAISTRYLRSREEFEVPEIAGYPPPAQILGKMVNAVFLDVLDRDVRRLKRLNDLVEKLAPDERDGLRPVRVLLIRPSRDLGRLAAGYEQRLPAAFRFVVRGLGSHQTKSPDFLSMLLFEPGYVRALMEIGETDAETHRDAITAWMQGGACG